ncbi:protein TolR [Uliginosibacterium sp. H3]|uniref:Protein TolR n=1 Tax=Uliginosibacterium silvisoli TaxID=3114758 RepID=A0ABU6JZT0_9RHOO|nr:protein TolR [Uliginosibacterium sp. H3]
MRQRRLKNEINVVPYIDVMLVLLVIFMVTAPMMPTGTVDLPSVAKSSQTKQQPLEVVIRSERELALQNHAETGGGKEASVSRDALVERLKSAQAANPEQPVVISANKNVRYEVVMQIMDLLQRNNINKVGLLVQQQAGK